MYASDEGEIAGYYTVSALSLELTQLPEELQRGRPRFPVPATLLGRLARDIRYARSGVGPFLLSHAMRNAYESSRNVASAFLVIDSKPDALDWYLRQAEFETLPSNPLRLVLPISVIADLLR